MTGVPVAFNQVELGAYGLTLSPPVPPASDIPTVVAGLVAIGATWVRIGAFWEIIETAPGTYSSSALAALDAALTAVTAAGINVLLCATNAPNFSPTPTLFGAFCTTLAQRYGTGGTAGLAIPVTHWEIWNEPNALFSAIPGFTVASMYAYQNAAYGAIKAVNSGAAVGTAGLLPVPDGFASTDAVTWMTGLYAQVPTGTPPTWDFVSWHPYSSTIAAGAQEPTTAQVWIAEIVAIHAVMVANGDGPSGRNLALWLTEFGFFTQPSGAAGGLVVTPTTQAHWLVEQVVNMNALAATAGVRLGPAPFVYNYRDSGADDGSAVTTNGAGVVSYAFVKKPAWAALAALISTGVVGGGGGGGATGLYRGATLISGIKLGATNISAVYKGSILVASSGGASDNFTRADSVGLGASWTDLGGTSPYLASVVNNQCKMNLGGVVTNALETDRQRYNVAQHPNDTGYIEIQAGTQGDTGQTTQVFRRANNTGSTLTNGVGIQLLNSTLSIVARVSSADTVEVACGSFTSGDVIRLTQVGTGTSAVHTMTKNGVPVGSWPDTAGVVPSGSTNRSMVVRVDGESNSIFFIFNSISYSPALSYVTCA